MFSLFGVDLISKNYKCLRLKLSLFSLSDIHTTWRILGRPSDDMAEQRQLSGLYKCNTTTIQLQ